MDFLHSYIINASTFFKIYSKIYIKKMAKSILVEKIFIIIFFQQIYFLAIFIYFEMYEKCI